ncbi:MAG: metallophosphoesterase family protein, partial [Nitrospirota bacterium]
MGNNTTVGVISDTHGLVRPEALEVLQGSDLIIHAGDIGKPEVLDSLRTIAPVYAVKGNIDKEPWSEELPHTEVVEIGSHFLYVLHELEHL